jgi:hypothetical protein
MHEGKHKGVGKQNGKQNVGCLLVVEEIRRFQDKEGGGSMLMVWAMNHAYCNYCKLWMQSVLFIGCVFG